MFIIKFVVALTLSILFSIADANPLSKTNEFWNNSVVQTTDLVAWGKSDFWASPEQLRSNGKGDCEDLAFAKFVDLLKAGVPASELRLLYVHAYLSGQQVAHMVVGYYGSGHKEDPLVLDSLTSQIKPLSTRSDLNEIFSFNAYSVWVHGAKRSSKPLTRFHELLKEVKL